MLSAFSDICGSHLHTGTHIDKCSTLSHSSNSYYIDFFNFKTIREFLTSDAKFYYKTQTLNYINCFTFANQ